MTTTKSQATETVADIAEDIIEQRGDMADEQVSRWAAAYTHWRSAVALLTTAELSDAIHLGRLRVIDRGE